MYSLRPLRRGRMPSIARDFFNSFWDWPNEMGFKVDIREEGNDYLIQAELPGMDKGNINLEIEGEYLVISAKSDERYDQEDDNNYIRKERRMMSCERQFYIGDVKPEEIQAKYNDGVLEVRVPNKTQTRFGRRSIEIQ